MHQRICMAVCCSVFATLSAAAPAQSTGSGASSAGDARETLEEIIVSAQKREERLQDVPIPVTSMDSTALADEGRYRLQDYYSQVAGLSLTTGDAAGAPMIAIRGISPEAFGNPTVGVMIDDVPFGSATAFGGGFAVPELDPSDLSRIEVLRGPQGTLYGAASMGGLLKYVTVDPSTAALSGQIRAGLADIDGADRQAYNVSASVNAPLSDALAVRVSGFTRREPGYIDNVQSGAQDVNRTRLNGARIAALWLPSSLVSVKLNALFEDNVLFGMPHVLEGKSTDNLQQAFIANTGRMDRKFAAYNATITADLGKSTLVSVTGYNSGKLDVTLDNSLFVGELSELIFPGSGFTIEGDGVRNTKFSQEVRLTTPLGERIDWLIGGFYTHETSPSYTRYTAADVNATPVGLVADFRSFSRYVESALFTDFTFHFNDRLDVQIGGRQSWMRQGYRGEDSGPYVPIIQEVPSPNVYPYKTAEESAFTYLVTPRFKFTPDVMLYARFASGYRPGGINHGFVPPEATQNFQPDKTQNFELGLKASAIDNRLSFDASLYYITWDDIQTSFLIGNNSFSYYDNGKGARSQGVELSVEALAAKGLKIGGWVIFNDSELTDDMPDNSFTIGKDGDRLSFSSRFSGSLTADYSFPIGADTTSSLGVAVSHVGKRVGGFLPFPGRQEYPAYTTTDVRMAFERDAWTAELYVNNATNERGIVGGGLGSLFPSHLTIIKPRTVGLALARTF